MSWGLYKWCVIDRHMFYWIVMVKRELNQKAELSTYKSFYIPVFICVQEFIDKNDFTQNDDLIHCLN